MDPFLRDLVPPTTEPVVEVSEEVIEPTVEVTEQEQQTRSLAPRFEIKPLIFSKEEFDTAVAAMGTENFAKDVANSFEEITGSSYEDLRKGKGPFIDFLIESGLLNVTDESGEVKEYLKKLDNNEIISIFTNAQRGEGQFSVGLESFMRTLPEAISSVPGFKAGVEIGKKVPTMVGKAVSIPVLGIAGSVGTGTIGRKMDERMGLTDMLLGSERILTPDMKNAEMAGETLAYFATFSPYSLLFKKKEYDVLGALTVMDNFNAISKIVQKAKKPVSKEVISAILGKNVDELLPPNLLKRALDSKAKKIDFEKGLFKGIFNRWKGRTDFGPRHLRLLAGFEKGINVSSARFVGPSVDVFKQTLNKFKLQNPNLPFFSNNPSTPSIVNLARNELQKKLGRELTLDLISGLGASAGAYFSDPNSPMSRFYLEVLGGLAPGLVVTSGIKYGGDAVKSTVKFLDDLVTPTGAKRKEKMWDYDAATRILRGIRASDQYKDFVERESEESADLVLSQLIDLLIENPLFKKEALEKGQEMQLMQQLLKGEIGGQSNEFARVLGLIIENVEDSKEKLAIESKKGKQGLINESERILLSFAALNSGEFSNKDAVISAGLLAEQIFKEGQQNKLDKILTNLNQRTEKLIQGGMDPRRTEYATNLKILLGRFVDEYTRRKDVLYGNLKNVMLSEFYDLQGRPSAFPLFVRNLRSKDQGGVLPNDPNLREAALARLGPAGESLMEMASEMGPIRIDASRLYEISTELKNLVRLNPDNEKSLSDIQKGVAKQLIKSIDMDLEKGNPNSTALALANAYNVAGKDVISRSFVKSLIGRDGTGAELLPPEIALDKLFSGGVSNVQKRFQDLQNVSALLQSKKFNKQLSVMDQLNIEGENAFNAEEFLGKGPADVSYQTTVNQIFGEFFRDITDVVTDPFGDSKLIVNEKKLKNTKRQPGFKDLLAMFPRVADDLASVERAQSVVDMKSISKGNLDDSKFSKSLNSLFKDVGTENRPETAERAINFALTSNSPVAELNKLFDIASGKGIDGKKFKNKTFRDIDTGDVIKYEDAIKGFKEQLFHYALGGSGKVNTNTFTTKLKGKMKNSNVSLLDWMKKTQIGEEDGKPIFMLNDKELERINEAVKQINNVEELFARGDIEQALYSNPTGMKIASAKMIGATLGQRSQEKFNDLLKKVNIGTERGGIGAGMVAANEGAKSFVDFFLKQPEVHTVNAMARILADDKVLGQMLREVKNKEDADRRVNIVLDFLYTGINQAFFRNRPYIIKLLSDEDLILLNQPSTPPPTYESDEFTPPSLEEPVEEVTEETTTETSQYLPSPLFRPRADAPKPTGTQTVAQGPVDRQRFAALFPEDADLIRGIGSLG